MKTNARMLTPVAALAFALLTTGPVLSASVGENVLINGGFEDTGSGPGSGWTFEEKSGPTEGFGFNNNDTYNGSPFGWWSAYIKDDDTPNVISTPITLQNGYTYQVAFWATVPWTSVNAPVTLRITDGTNAPVWLESFSLDSATHGEKNRSTLVRFSAKTSISFTRKGEPLGAESSGLKLVIMFDEHAGGNDIVVDNIEVNVTSLPGGSK
jgi:hypothetical protein